LGEFSFFLFSFHSLDSLNVLMNSKYTSKRLTDRPFYSFTFLIHWMFSWTENIQSNRFTDRPEQQSYK
jgi:hypothetical protein